jgi:hypothetical protein
MHLDIKPSIVTITFSPYEYCLCKCEDEMLGDFTLNHLIDRSEKGKSPDIGLIVMYLSEQEAETFIKAGFTRTY